MPAGWLAGGKAPWGPSTRARSWRSSTAAGGPHSLSYPPEKAAQRHLGLPGTQGPDGRGRPLRASQLRAPLIVSSLHAFPALPVPDPRGHEPPTAAQARPRLFLLYRLPPRSPALRLNPVPKRQILRHQRLGLVRRRRAGAT